MEFKQFIVREGEAKVAKLCGMSPRAVAAWRYGARRPRPDTARLIIEGSRGELSWNDIYPDSRSAPP
jgi:DNA-binding transcriptional regulator YdaS (Cro superfamily)